MWHKITVEQYQQVYELSKAGLDDVDKLLQVIGILYNLTEAQVNDLPVKVYHRLIEDIQQTFTSFPGSGPHKAKIKAGGKTYQLSYQVEKMRYGQWVEVQHFLEQGIIEHLHLIAASIASPVRFGCIKGKNDSKTHDKRADDFLQANFKDLYNSVVFFCSASKGLRNLIQASLT